ncbi:hypothetical protein PsYK624_000270 [Phanerochaete sordida]|uniref:Uncharacterized protein n=1 Tax=Phanerochaete sordida TaxID=48140 RepID=A0A9P3FX52_9APHY|nr:hypothetical protein PsYK624_000270 [Phanerochaete sordida]
MSRSPSPTSLEAKRTMETKVAIIEQDPHRFKLSPLRSVPQDQRVCGSSPSMNFDKHFVGRRLQPPSLYQHAPSRSASIYSFASVNSTISENGSIQIGSVPLESLSPLGAISQSSSLERAGVLDDASGAGLGLSNIVPVRSTGFLAATSDTLPIEDLSSRSFSTSSSLASQRSWGSVSPGADLTFGASDESTGPSLHTPDPASVPSSKSSESFRKAKSMHVLADLSGLASPLNLEPKQTSSISPSRSSSLRHLKAKTVTLSPGDNGESYRHKRHAIYGADDRRVQLSLSYKEWNPTSTPRTPGSSGSLSRDRSSVSAEPSPSVLAVERKEAACRASQKKGSLLATSRSRSALNCVDPNLPTSAFLSVPSISTTENPDFRSQAAAYKSVLPLKFKPTLSKPNYAKSLRHDTIRHHPIIDELLQDINAAISEWRIVGSLTNKF